MEACGLTDQTILKREEPRRAKFEADVKEPWPTAGVESVAVGSRLN